MHKFNGTLQPFSLLQLVVKDILQTDFEAQLQTPRQISDLVKVRRNCLRKRTLQLCAKAAVSFAHAYGKQAHYDRDL